MVAALKKGDQVITQGGLIGKVVGVRDDELDVELADEQTKRDTLAASFSAELLGLYDKIRETGVPGAALLTQGRCGGCRSRWRRSRRGRVAGRRLRLRRVRR